jgi:predicted transcriptional regulator
MFYILNHRMKKQIVIDESMTFRAPSPLVKQIKICAKKENRTPSCFIRDTLIQRVSRKVKAA